MRTNKLEQKIRERGRKKERATSKRIEFFQSKKNRRWIFNMKYDSEKVVSCTSGFERINH